MRYAVSFFRTPIAGSSYTICAILAQVANKVDNPWTKAGAYMGLIFVIPVAGYAGYALGGYLGGKNWGDIGAIVGVAVGFFETYRQVMRIEGKK